MAELIINCSSCDAEILESSFGEWFCQDCGHDNTGEFYEHQGQESAREESLDW